MRLIATIGAALLVCCTGLHAASYWEISNAEVDETIAGPQAGATPLTALGSDIPFGDFRYPHVDVLENVTFIVDPGGHHGIYRSDSLTRTLTALVKSDETELPVPGGKPDYIRGLQMDGEDFVFNATDSQGGRGLYLWRNGKLSTLARKGETILPGDTAPLGDVEYGGLSGGYVLYTASNPKGHALVLQNVALGGNRVLLRSGHKIPGRDDAAFEYFSPQNWINGEDIVFRAARVSDPYDNPNQEEGVRGLYGWFGQMPANPDGFRLSDLRTIADWTTPIPGMEGRKFTDFRSAPVHKGLVAFVGSGKGCTGVYLYNAHARDSKPRVIVDSETTLPSLFPGTFRGFGAFPTVINDCVVFTAAATSGYKGVFLYNASTDTLFVLADNRAPLAGKTVKNFEIAGHFLVRNRFAITATFEDDTSGVYLATIPAEGFTRMGAPGL